MTPEPLKLDLSKPALAELSAAVEFVRVSGGDAERFAARVTEAFRSEAARLAGEVEGNENGKPFDQPDGAASIRYAKPVYRLRVETAARRARRSNTGLWYAYYALLDVSGRGKPDTMQVITIRHSARRPIGEDGG